MGSRRAASKSQGSKSAATGAAERRRGVRFAVMLRVDYEAGGRGTFSFSSNLSTAGVQLRGATRLAVGDELPVALHLKTERQPVRLQAVVRHVSGGAGGGAGLEFLPGQAEAVEAIGRFIDEELIGKLEASLARSLTSTPSVVLLAGHYVQVGRVDDAVDLYRRALEATPAATALHEGLGALLLARLREGAGGPGALAELEALLAEGQAVADGPALRALQKGAAEQRKALERADRERAEQAEAQRKLEERQREQAEKQREQKLRAALAREAQAQADKELAARRRELERELEGRRAEADAAAAEERKGLKAERAALSAQAEQAKELEARLGRQEQKLGQRAARLEEERQALLAEVEAQRGALAEAKRAATEREEQAAARLAGVAAEEQAAAERVRALEREVAAEGREVARRRAELAEAEKLQASLEKARAEAVQLRRELEAAGQQLAQRQAGLEAG
ncbi:MAG TPA: PilZ domain-containing protein, partial [Anaeromyxobacteraceae bacterium]|nr:PilZ domain-containing protein [Anaeromyxobacteraceae bacterium]